MQLAVDPIKLDVMLNGEILECFNTFEEADAYQNFEKKVYEKKIGNQSEAVSLDFNDYNSKTREKNLYGIKSVVREGDGVVS